MNRSQISPLIQPYYPALDGLRAVAFLLVFLLHYGTMAFDWKILHWGWVGVDLFFVLSGFLITGILYDSLHRADFFSNFYIRRALRIFPLFYGFWIVMLALTPVLHIVWNRYNFAMMGYIGNFFIPGALLGLHGTPLSIQYASFHHPGQFRLINVTSLWSLCVEEQFYLVWPAVVWLVRSRATLMRICVAAILVIPIARAFYIHGHPTMLIAGAMYHWTWPRVDTLLMGAGLALWLRGPSPSVRMLRRFSYAAIVAVPAILALLLWASPSSPDPMSNPLISTIGFSLIAIAASGVLILAIDRDSHLMRWLQFRPLLFLGRISYGLYFFHGLPSGYFFDKSQALAPRHLAFLIPLIALAVTLIAAMLSFRFLESPFLRMKSSLAPRPGAADDPTPAA